MKVNSSGASFSRSESMRSSRRSNRGVKESYPSPSSSPLPPKSPSFNYQCTVDPPNVHSHYIKAPSSPNYPSSPKSPSLHQVGQKSPGYCRSPSSQSDCTFSFPPGGSRSPNVQTERVFDFVGQYPQQKSPRSPHAPKSPRNFSYEDEASGSALNDSPSSSSFNLQSPPKSKVNLSKAYHRQQYQSSKSDSTNSKSSLEYKSTTKHPTGAYQDIEYKVCHSLDSGIQKPTYRYEASRHSSIKDKKKRKPPCNIRTNPVYDERYSSSKSINESVRHEKSIQRCRKSTSDLTDLTDDAGNTTMTSLSRPSSPRRKGSVKGGLAYLASRRGSRDSLASNMSNVSCEDIGPLNFQNTARGRQRRTSNFLELPGKFDVVMRREATYTHLVNEGWGFLGIVNGLILLLPDALPVFIHKLLKVK